MFILSIFYLKDLQIPYKVKKILLFCNMFKTQHNYLKMYECFKIQVNYIKLCLKLIWQKKWTFIPLCAIWCLYSSTLIIRQAGFRLRQCKTQLGILKLRNTRNLPSISESSFFEFWINIWNLTWLSFFLFKLESLWA